MNDKIEQLFAVAFNKADESILGDLLQGSEDAFSEEMITAMTLLIAFGEAYESIPIHDELGINFNEAFVQTMVSKTYDDHVFYMQCLFFYDYNWDWDFEVLENMEYNIWLNQEDLPKIVQQFQKIRPFLIHQTAMIAILKWSINEFLRTDILSYIQSIRKDKNHSKIALLLLQEIALLLHTIDSNDALGHELLSVYQTWEKADFTLV